MLTFAASVHDDYEWLSGVWIPLGVGIATVVLALAAVATSVVAIVIAVRSERARASEQLKSMARQESTVLTRWVSLSLAQRVPRPRGLREDISQEELALRNARADAEAALHASLVPGATTLLELTRFDLTHRWDDLPYLMLDEDDITREEERALEADRAAERINLLKRREERMMARIRGWANDPEKYAGLMETERKHMERSPAAYQTLSPAF